MGWDANINPAAPTRSRRSLNVTAVFRSGIGFQPAPIGPAPATAADPCNNVDRVSLHGDRAGADHVDQGFDGDGNDTPAARHYIRSRIRTILPTADPEPIGLALRNR
jgi:hypothetical protein